MLIQEVNSSVAFKYNKHYVGLAKDGIADNFITVRPRKSHILAEFRVPRSDELTAQLSEAGVDLLNLTIADLRREDWERSGDAAGNLPRDGWNERRCRPCHSLDALRGPPLEDALPERQVGAAVVPKEGRVAASLHFAQSPF